MLNSFAQGHLNKPVTAREVSEYSQTQGHYANPQTAITGKERIYGSNYDFRILNTEPVKSSFISCQVGILEENEQV